VVRELVRLDNQGGSTGEEQGETEGQRVTRITQRAIYRIWPDFKIKKLTTKSVSTVKADAARVSFSAFGDDIVWAVIDSGIDGGHPHFTLHKNLDLKKPLRHRDFTSSDEQPLRDEFGHGTHVAGIIAGAMMADTEEQEEHKEIRAVTRHRDDGDLRDGAEVQAPQFQGARRHRRR
jgi:subtilisin family serine protease